VNTFFSKILVTRVKRFFWELKEGLSEAKPASASDRQWHGALPKGYSRLRRERLR